MSTGTGTADPNPCTDNTRPEKAAGAGVAERAKEPPSHFIRERISADVAAGKISGTVVTRFPPEPNGYLHIGHAKSICLNFGMALEFGGVCNLRFDDTNPETEDVEYVESIKEDVRWLGFDWGERLFYASGYFDKLYEYARDLIRQGKAYVCELDSEAFKEYRGVPTRPGKPSPWRNRPIDESLDLFARMRNGEFPAGRYVLRAKIDMNSPNLHLRDPAVYRIKHEAHHRTGREWHIYPMYDFAHGLSDAIEGVTHSLCTLEFEVHRPLYDWFLDQLDVPIHPQQIEFARLNLTHTVLSKRKLALLVKEGHVSGWDDPRMPTVSGLRRRGFTPGSIRTFSERVGVAKRENVIDLALLEHCIREDLEENAERRMGVVRPLKVVIENYPEDSEEMLVAANHPTKPEMGEREVPFCREVYIDRDDFMEDPPKNYYRLSPGTEVRLRYAYLVTCTDVVRDPGTDEIVELKCRYDPGSRGGNAPDGRRVKGTIHWVSARHGVNAAMRLYDHLFAKADPEDLEPGQESFLDNINPGSLKEVVGVVEPGAAAIAPGVPFQFERTGYFCLDPKDARPGVPVFNRTVALRDSWAKMQRK